MPTRRYLSFSIDQLEQEFKRVDDIQDLKALNEELCYRRTPSARKLKIRVEKRLEGGHASANVVKPRAAAPSGPDLAKRVRRNVVRETQVRPNTDAPPADLLLRKRLAESDEDLERSIQRERELQRQILQLKDQLQAAENSRSADAARARQREQYFQQQFERAQIELAQLRNVGEDVRLFAAVGLHPNCSKELIVYVQRFWRKQYHPDSWTGKSERDRVFAQEKFKEIDQAFSQIQKRRGFS